MQCDVSHDGDVAVIRLQGRLVAGVGDILLRDSINELLADERKKILIDLSGVTHIDSSGVASLVEALQTARKSDTRFALVSVSDSAMRVLELARLDKVFTIHATLSDGLEDGG